MKLPIIIKRAAEPAIVPKPKWGMTNKGSSFARDLLAGVEPTGAITFDSALANKNKHGMHKALNMAGGFIGGSAIIPGIISGLALGVPRYLGGGKGRSARFISDAVIKPYRVLYEGARAKKELGNIVKRNGNSTKFIERLMGHSSVNELKSGMGSGNLSPATRAKAKDIGRSAAGDAFFHRGTAIDSATRQGREQLPDMLRQDPALAAEMKKTINTGLMGGVGMIGLSGATNSLSAMAQYNSGLKAQRLINPQPTPRLKQ